MEFWPTFLDFIVLLAVAFAFGALCERLKQSALLGYLLAGMLLGPNALHVISTSEEVFGLAEVGVSLLLFSLGLEFSWRRLRGLGARALGGGVLQVTLTLAVIATGAALLDHSFRTAVIIGAAFTLSSTAGVLRVLMSRTEIDSAHGRLALGVLLFQDLAVVPLVLLAGVLGSPDGGAMAWQDLGWTVLMLVGLVTGLYITFNHIVPRVFLATSGLQNRELPVLFAVVGALSAIYAAHSLGLSPAIGAFIAGMLLGESPFATQVRADLSALRTLLVTVFFCSVGMLADPTWIVAHLDLAISVAAAVIVAKALFCAIALRLLGVTAHSALATGIALSQVGEFAFLIAESSRGTLIDDALFMVIASTMMITLLVTPFLVATAPRLATLILRPLARIGWANSPDLPTPDEAVTDGGHVVLIGYGPAGECCGALLREKPNSVTVLDMNPKLVTLARDDGFSSHLGDATHPEVLEHLGIRQAEAVVVTLPDPRIAERVVKAVRSASSEVPIIVRSRYHKYAESLEPTGPGAVVDEEQEVGERLGWKVLAALELARA